MKITIKDVVKKANEAGYKTYHKSTTEPMPLYGGGMTERKYTLEGDSWETPYSIKESELEKEYNVFCSIIADK